MDFSIRPVGAPAPAPIAPPVRAAVEHAVATDLPARSSVTVADPTGRSRNDPQADNDPESHQVIVDHDAAAIVYRVVDDRTNAVIRQFPDEAMLRRRAYFRTLEMKAEGVAHTGTDRKA